MAFQTSPDATPPLQSNRASKAREKFEYLAMDDGGRELRGTVLAVDDVDASAKLTAQGLFPIEVWRNKGDVRRSKKREKFAGTRRREDMARSKTLSSGQSFFRSIGMVSVIKIKLLCVMTRQLSTMLDAGLPLLISLRTLEEQCGRSPSQKAMKEVIGDLIKRVESGMPLSEALSLHPRSFSRLYVGLVRAGEASGAMEEVLNRLAEYMEKNQRMIKKVKSGMAYPVVVLIIASLITLGLMVGVVPQFAEMFNEILEGVPLPAITNLVIGISNVIMGNKLLLFGGFFIFIVLFRVFSKTKTGSYFIDWASVTFPPLNSLVKKVAVARFCSTLGTLLNAGVPILDALQIVSETSGNELMRRTIQKVHSCVSEGDKIARPLDSCKIFPKMVIRMIDIGEKTGALPDMLKRIAKTFEEEVEMALEALISLIEPLMICFLAVVVGGIVLALFLPLIKIIEQLGV